MWRFWRRRSKTSPEDNGRPACICGAQIKIVNFNYWDWRTNRKLRYYGAYSCPTQGCSGNTKELCERQLAAMEKLSEEEKRVLGLWDKWA